MKRGRIITVNLNNRNLAGTFPTSVFGFSELHELSMQYNGLEGDLAALIAPLAQSTPAFAAKVTKLNLRDNHLEGNIGALVQYFPALEQLNVCCNCFAEIDPAISDGIQAYFCGQQIDQTVEVNLSTITAESFYQSVPSLMRYFGRKMFHEDKIQLRLSTKLLKDMTTEDFCLGITLTPLRCDSYWNASFYASPVFRGNSGDILYIGEKDNSESSFKVKLLFEQGDANFVDGVDAADLQATILYAFGEYSNKLFNFTAADTYVDGNINVQDVVCTVNILLAQDNAQAVRQHKVKERAGESEETDASISVENGKVILRSIRPVAALSLKAWGNVEWQLAQYGLTESVKDGAVVAYSLGGTTLPAGETVLGICDGDAVVTCASLADAEAQTVSVRIAMDDATCIRSTIDARNGDHSLYDLQGRRIASPRRGVNILRSGSHTKKVVKDFNE